MRHRGLRVCKTRFASSDAQAGGTLKFLSSNLRATGDAAPLSTKAKRDCAQLRYKFATLQASDGASPTGRVAMLRGFVLPDLNSARNASRNRIMRSRSLSAQLRDGAVAVVFFFVFFFAPSVHTVVRERAWDVGRITTQIAHLILPPKYIITVVCGWFVRIERPRALRSFIATVRVCVCATVDGAFRCREVGWYARTGRFIFMRPPISDSVVFELGRQNTQKKDEFRCCCYC